MDDNPPPPLTSEQKRAIIQRSPRMNLTSTPVSMNDFYVMWLEAIEEENLENQKLRSDKNGHS